VALLAASAAAPPAPRLVWNATPSVARGLYLVTPATRLVAGDLVVARLPERHRRLAVRRGYLPERVPLLKPVAAIAGDLVCVRGHLVLVGGRAVAARRAVDGAGRALPQWKGCVRLGDDELFLLAGTQGESFDGRYFGVSARRHVIGKARLLWAA